MKNVLVVVAGNIKNAMALETSLWGGFAIQ